MIELIAVHPAWHWRRSALHAIRPSLNTQTAAHFLHFHPRWRHFRRIWGRIFSRSGEIFSGFGGADFFQRIWRNFQRVWAGFYHHWRVWSLRMSSNFHRFCRIFAPHTPAFPRFPLLTGGLCLLRACVVLRITPRYLRILPDGGTADLARALRLAPANARFKAHCRAASRAVLDFSLSTGGKEGGNRHVVCLMPDPRLISG